MIERAVFQRANRLGLLAFAGSTSVKVPLTTDHLAFRNKLETINVGSAPRGGTSIAAAIRRASDLFAKSPEGATKIILLFTDGEDHEGGPVEAAELALEERGIRTFTIGVGDASRSVGVQVPLAAGSTAKDFHRLVDALAGLKKAQLTTEERTRHKPRYQWFLAVALLLLTLEPMIRERGPKRTDVARRVWQQEFST